MLVATFPALAEGVGDGPTIEHHLGQQEIESGTIPLSQLVNDGRRLFAAKFNRFDGQGRPGTTGGGAPRVSGSAPPFIRTSAPDANSCAGCHNDPVVGGAGDIVANVFVLAQTLDPVTESVSPDFSNERNTLGMQGSGAIEMLAREMTATLITTREAAIQQAKATAMNVTRELLAKGVSFGSITAKPDGNVDTTQVQGINADLIIRPFHQKGVVVSLREFSNNAFNHHHGMQSVERFGQSMTGSHDFDQDGVSDELTVGDITAATIYQAALNIPGQRIPNDGPRARAIVRGERSFARIGCGSCHVAEMTLDNPVFSEPNPYNPPGNLRPADVGHSVTFDLTSEGELPRLERSHDGKAYVRAYTDLKRHNLCDSELTHFCNEKVVQGGVPTGDFITRKLWDVGSTAPYGHRGDLTTITDAIYYHGGEARTSRDAFFASSDEERSEVIEFLKSLQILPAGTPSLVVDENGNRRRAARR
ncbi:MAG: hypothetical protein HYU52_03240 [Acidobacteria bacterium]|nr:hypothetical protein [Acidobacteriota bacterium]